MRATRSPSGFLVAVSACAVGLCFVFCGSVVPKETEKTNARLKELQQKRLIVLEKLHTLAKKGFADGISSQEEVHTTKVELMSARIEYAETRQDRIKACEEAIQEAVNWHNVIEQAVKAKTLPQFDELKAQAYLLDAQIAREKAEVEDE